MFKQFALICCVFVMTMYSICNLHRKILFVKILKLLTYRSKLIYNYIPTVHTVCILRSFFFYNA